MQVGDIQKVLYNMILIILNLQFNKQFLSLSYPHKLEFSKLKNILFFLFHLNSYQIIM
jgi:hypothetical protein